MSQPQPTWDVLIIGAGVVGLSAARKIAGEGRRVAVVERERIGAEASSAAAGMLLAQTEADPDSPLLPLKLEARALHVALAAELLEETGIDVELRKEGLIALAFGQQAETELRERVRWQSGKGYPAEELSLADVARIEPILGRDARSAALFSDEMAVDNVRLVKALANAAIARGAEIHTGVPATAVVVEGGRVAGVELGGRCWRAAAVIDAAGAWSGRLAGVPTPPQVEPVRGEIVALDPSPKRMRHIVVSDRGYLVPRGDGRILAGSTAERVGFNAEGSAAGVGDILSRTFAIAPDLGSARVLGSWAGLRPSTPDALPIVGRADVDGLIHATGLYRQGILLGPLVGHIAAELAMGRDSSQAIDALRPGRFHRRGSK